MRARARPTNPESPPGAADRARSFTIGPHVLAAPRAAAGLHIVATPIGHLGDVTLRALETLAGCDLVACEDTRVTAKLLERYGISAALTPYHEHNAAAARPKLLKRLAEGASIALVSDAGTPLISDPGFKLVRAAQAAGHKVTTVPGASSVMAALTVAGLPTDRFFYDGFLPAKDAARRSRIAELTRIDASLVLFESGSRVAAALADLASAMGAREAALCRELTKLHEEVLRGTLDELARRATDIETRGEFVLVIAPPAETAMAEQEVEAMLREALRNQSVKDAVAQVTEASGRPRREVYALALALGKASR